MDTKDKTNRDNLCVLLSFFALAIIMIFVMVRNFNVIDLCYFGVIVFFGTRYLLLCKE